jgi:hypothetical protein
MPAHRSNHHHRSSDREERRCAWLRALCVWAAVAGCDRYPLPDGFADNASAALPTMAMESFTDPT